MIPKSVYLDSNDFSDLSRPEDELNNSDRDVLALLRDAARNKRARFFISAVHISEAVHASQEYKIAAVRRARLMQELGAENILRLPLDICKVELARAFAGEGIVKCSLAELTSKSNEWFGTSIPLDSFKERRDEIGAAIDQSLQRLNRAQRRSYNSRSNPRKKDSQNYIRSLVKDGLSQSSPSTIPTSLLNPELALNWYLGKTSDDKFRQNTVGVVSDPYLLFNYFIDELGHRETLYRILREQGERWVNLVQDTTSQAIPLMALAKDGNETLDLKRLVAQITGEAFWRNVVGSFAELDLSNYCEADILKAKDKSPSTSLFTYVLIESLLLKLQSTASRVSSGNLSAPPVNRSDYADFMHAIYAPYFDVFRCDSRIGEVLKRTPIANNRIAARRRDLLSMLSP